MMLDTYWEKTMLNARSVVVEIKERINVLRLVLHCILHYQWAQENNEYLLY